MGKKRKRKRDQQYGPPITDSRRWQASAPGPDGVEYVGFGYGYFGAVEALVRYMEARMLPPPTRMEVRLVEHLWIDSPAIDAVVPFPDGFAAAFREAIGRA